LEDVASGETGVKVGNFQYASTHVGEMDSPLSGRLLTVLSVVFSNLVSAILDLAKVSAAGWVPEYLGVGLANFISSFQ
jgi:hypothetical protein